MQWPSKKYPFINTLLIIAFLIMWLYTEVSEYNERHAIYMEFNPFHDAGERFTAEEGRTMYERLCALELMHDIECRD